VRERKVIASTGVDSASLLLLSSPGWQAANVHVKLWAANAELEPEV